MSKLTIIAIAALVAQTTPSGWEREGRPLPRPTMHDIRIDDGLAPYTSCRPDLVATASGSVTAILPDLFARWNTAFRKWQLAVKVTAAPPFGPPQGKLSLRLAEFLDGKSDFALTSRPLTTEDLQRFHRARRQDPAVIPVATGSWRNFGFVDTVVVIVNAANPVDRMTYSQIAAIFGAEDVSGNGLRDWGKAGANGWQGRAIRPVGSGNWNIEESARSAVIREKVLQGRQWREDLEKSISEAAAPAEVAADVNAIAITGLGHLPKGAKALAISVHDSGPFITPDFASVLHGRYPLSRTVDMLVPRQPDGTIAPAVDEFLRFILSREGQKIVARQGVFLPLRANQIAESLERLGTCPHAPEQASARGRKSERESSATEW